MILKVINQGKTIPNAFIFVMSLGCLPYTGSTYAERHSLKLSFVTLFLDYPMSLGQKGIFPAKVTLHGQPI